VTRTTRIPWYVMIVLAVVLGGLAAASTSSKPKLSNPGERAVIVPTDRARTVIVPPCATGVSVTPSSARRAERTSGATVVRLAAGRGVRTVLVPVCSTVPHKAQSTGSNLPSAAFVLPVGAKGPAANGGKGVGISENIEAQLVVPQGSPVTTIVVPECEHPSNQKKSGQGRVVVIGGLHGRSTTALAPAC
jgi:hypothetical protein